jgi:RHS repeat-associated protein
MPTGYGFTGRHWDASSGLYYYRERYYDPAMGRFISEDPIGFWGGSNFYAYVRNNPVLLVDPLGLAPSKKCGGCDPRSEEEELRRGMREADRRITLLETTGSALSPEGGDRVCAQTECTYFRIPGTSFSFTGTPQTTFLPPCQNLTPCVKECVDMHEGVHRRMCKRLGLKYADLSELQGERPAYMTEMGCYIRMLRAGGLYP